MDSSWCVIMLTERATLGKTVPHLYKPWFDNYRNALIAFVFSFAIFYAVYGDYLPIFAMAFCVAAFLYGLQQIKSAMARKFGKDLERGAINSASPLLLKQGFRVKSSVLVAGLGDVDMIVTNHNHKKVTVEIKSFIHWNQFGPFKGQRESKAIVQAERQKEAVNADAALIWLPQGRRSLVQILLNWVGSSHVDVVFGDASKLARVLKRI